jgi:hypothetical protein
MCTDHTKAKELKLAFFVSKGKSQLSSLPNANSSGQVVEASHT